MSTSKSYDFQKAKSIIEEKKELLSEASMGMHEDWFWTARDVWKDGSFTVELTDQTEIGGIQSSYWATPTLQLIYKDGEEEMLECFIGEQDISFGDKIQQQIMCNSGVLSSQVQANITPLKTN